MSWRNDRFNQAMFSLDALCEGRDISKWPALSDGGAGARTVREGLRSRLRNASAWQARSTEREQRLFEAEIRLVEAGKGRLIPVLRLIAKNGNDFHASIEELARTCKNLNSARKKYFEHRGLLMRFFGAQK